MNILLHDARCASTRLLAKLALAGLLVLGGLATIGCGTENAVEVVTTPVPTSLCSNCSGGGGLINSSPLGSNDNSNGAEVRLP